MTAQAQRPGLSGRSVLVVEDEYYLATELAEQISRVGGSVIGPFATADEGLVQLVASAPGCALLDINTGEGPSFVLADALIVRSVPFAFLTGYDAGAVPERFSGVERIEKPARDREVMRALSQLCGG